MLLLLPAIQVQTLSNPRTPENPASAATFATDKSNISINLLFCRHMQFATFATDYPSTNIIKPPVPPKTLLLLLLLLPTSQTQA